MDYNKLVEFLEGLQSDWYLSFDSRNYKIYTSAGLHYGDEGKTIEEALEKFAIKFREAWENKEDQEKLNKLLTK